MRRVVLAAVAAGLVVGSLAGCAGSEGVFSVGAGSTPAPSVKPSIESGSNLSGVTGEGDRMFYQELPSGAKVLCVLVTDDSDTGQPALSCDWGNAQGLNKPASK